MASPEKEQIVTAIARTLKANGFKKKGATWHRQQGEFIQALNVQGSQWSKSFYLNLGIYLCALGDNKTPTEYRCHIRNRVEDVCDDRSRCNAFLDLENEIPADARFRDLESIIETRAIPWLEEFSNDARIVHCITQEQPHGLAISKKVFRHYNVEEPT